MDGDREGGKVWRQEMSRWLMDELQIISFDPYHKPLHDFHRVGLEDDDNHAQIVEAIACQDYDLVRELVKPIVSTDLRCVDFADFILCNLDMQKRPCGTFDELYMAAGQRKPVIVHSPHGIQDLPPWLFGRLRPELFFSSWDDIKDYLKHIAFDDDIDDLGKWKFFDIEKYILEIIQQDYHLVSKNLLKASK